MSTTERPAHEPLSASTDAPYPSPARAWYVVGVLMVLYILSFVDRQILSLMVDPMKADLGVTDSQMGALTGFYFALFYAVCGFPLGRLADTRSRRGIIFWGLAAWSFFTTASGVAKNFLQLAICRGGVGIGEASLSPSAYSILTDYFPPSRRSAAISAYSMGIYIGSGLAFIVGGTVVGWAIQHPEFELPIFGQVRSWQLVFICVGLPGLILSLLLLTIREPVRRGRRVITGPDGKVQAAQASLSEVGVFLGRNWVTFVCHTVGFALLSLSSNANGFWIPSIFKRIHLWSPKQTGLVFGLIVAVFCTAGVFTAGWIVDRMIKNGTRDAAMRLAIIGTILAIPTGILFPLCGNAALAAVLLIPGSFLNAMPFGVAPAAIQQITPNTMRGMASAVYLFVVNFIGMSVGPWAVGMMNDYVFIDPDGKGKFVNYSLLTVCLTSNILALCFLAVGLKYFRKSDAENQQLTGGQH